MIPLCVVSEHVSVSSTDLGAQGSIVVDDSYRTGFPNGTKLSDDMILVGGELVVSVRVAEEDSLLVPTESTNPFSGGGDTLLRLGGSSCKFQVSDLVGLGVISVNGVERGDDFVEIDVFPQQDVTPDWIGDLRTIGLADEALLGSGDVACIDSFAA